MRFKKWEFGILISFLVVYQFSFAQQIHFHHTPFNYLYNNPAAYTEKDFGSTKAVSFFQFQEKSHIELLSLNHHFLYKKKNVKKKGEIGLYAMNQNDTNTNNLDIKLSYSHHFTLRTGGIFGIGLRGGIFHSQFYDKAISIFKPDIGIGLWYQTVKYYGGISINNSYQKIQNEESIFTNYNNVTFIVGYISTLTGSIKLVSNGLFNTNFENNNFDIGTRLFIYDDKYWGGLTLRKSTNHHTSLVLNELVFSFGIGLLKRTNDMSGRISNPLKIGYAFDLKSDNKSSHELFLSYKLPIKMKINPPPIRNKGYRPYSAIIKLSKSFI